MKKCCRLVGTFGNSNWKAWADGHLIFTRSLRAEGFLRGSAGKESACDVGHLGSVPGLGRSRGEGNSYPLKNSGLENSMDCIVHRVAKSWTRLSNFHFSLPFSKCPQVGPGKSIQNGADSQEAHLDLRGKFYSHSLKIITWKDFISLNLIEMHIKTANYLRLASGKKSTNNKCWRWCGERGALLPWCWQGKLLTARKEDRWRRFLKQVERERH